MLALESLNPPTLTPPSILSALGGKYKFTATVEMLRVQGMAQKEINLVHVLE